MEDRMTDEEKANLKLLLNNKLNDIRYTKQQQWHLLYLTLIAIGGITSLALSTKPLLCYFGFFLIAFVIIIGVLGSFFIIYYAVWLSTYRDEKNYYQQQLGINSNQKNIRDNVVFTVSFCFVIVFTLVASIWAIIQLY